MGILCGACKTKLGSSVEHDHGQWVWASNELPCMLWSLW